MTSFGVVVERLCDASERPLPGIDWPGQLDPEGWAMSPGWTSIHGTGVAERLDPSQRRRLCLLEAAHFFSLNIHGERRLMAGLASRLYRADSGDHDRYLHHFLAEENEHSALFGRFCRDYVGKVYPERKLALPELAERPRREADILFYAQVLLFEEIVDRVNVAQARDARLMPVVRAIHARHHADESRHLAFGRLMLRRLVAGHEVRREVQVTLRAFLELTLRELGNPAVYADAGLPDPYGLLEVAFASPAQRALRVRVAGTAARFLHGLGLLASPEVP